MMKINDTLGVVITGSMLNSPGGNKDEENAEDETYIYLRITEKIIHLKNSLIPQITMVVLTYNL